MKRLPPALALAGLLLVSCETAPRPQAAEPAAAPQTAAGRCAHHDPNRNLYWGDLHVHTAFSSDAWRSEVRTTPDDAYRFARGEALRIPPLDEAGNATQRVRLARPLDFAAVTDHVEYMGAVALCTDPRHPAYASEACRYFRRLPATPAHPRPPDVPPREQIHRELCGPDASLCKDAARTPWRVIQEAAARWNDPRTCEFSTFVAYEWSGARGGPLLHRNVIFRSDAAAEPISSLYDPTPHDLWRRLQAECLDAGNGCDVLAIPHNSNTSQGRMFALSWPGASTVADEIAQARRRGRLEPLVEIMQHKGDSECRDGLEGVLGDADELCDFEKLFPAAMPQCQADTEIAGNAVRCTDVGGYARNGLALGMAEQQRIGVNPLRYGFIASTDTHNASSGAVDEYDWKGAIGSRDATTRARLGGDGSLRGTVNNPGGLAAVWAEQNTREALFDAMRRRETYGTSGPRMSVRLFGGWEYPEDLCSHPEFVAQGYARGVPMGGELPDRPSQAHLPTFAVRALRDPGTADHPGDLLQRVQIVKVWPGEDGAVHQRVIDVAGDADNGAGVDPVSCEPRGPGDHQLCAVWRDTEFEPGQRVAYYARVLENPSCRWSARQCAGLDPLDRELFGCDAAGVPRRVQERAWTSPIWYGPG